MVGRGHLARSRPLLDEFSERPDEVGGLARPDPGHLRLQQVVRASQRLARHIEANVANIDGAAAAVATGAARQEEQLTPKSPAPWSR